MNVLIIEDENIAVQRLTEMLHDLEKDVRIVNVLDSVKTSIAFLQQAPELDLIFMDIELGDGQSLEIFEKVSIDTPVIFITAYQEHALKAFKQNSVDYLLKPLHKSELKAALEKYKRLHGRPDTQLQKNVLRLLEEMKAMDPVEFKERFLAKTGTRMISVPARNIAYFYTKERCQYIKTATNDDLILDKALDEVENEVDKKAFFRANRQFIINYNHIEKVQSWFAGKLKVQVRPAAHEEIIISRLRAADFKKWLGE
ncbi:response regulator transcription factor [Pseudoflavitalea sp. X16]|uniref:LytR/AlgR family response regulator transcription factor n=1 Tax=Paraflavitalea devenefica TaxID=2716334 RepID=UPI0014227002|nr:LytTR family DNA-binding domain-containing protein [Paraflavitalea devenefica]NII27055.1 response regulator transcription factor [Paraflavitalea devenefica]